MLQSEFEKLTLAENEHIPFSLYLALETEYSNGVWIDKQEFCETVYGSGNSAKTILEKTIAYQQDKFQAEFRGRLKLSIQFFIMDLIRANYESQAVNL